MKFISPIKVSIFFFLFSSLGQADERFLDYPPFAERSFEYRFPTERFIESNGWENISSGLKSLGVSMVYRNLFDRVWHREEPGFVGYHGSTQEYRIYQDIIRFLIEEKLEIRIRDDFHFFRIPGDPQLDCETLAEYGDYEWNYSPTHFLCLNYALYGNYYSPSSCSYYYFAANSSKNFLNYESKISFLFNKLGIDISHIKGAFAIGRSHLGGEMGVLIQIFDMSHFNPWKNYYTLVDEQCGGFEDKPISEIVSGVEPESFPCQIRMLMSNRHTLDPFSPLVIKRYDVLDPVVTKRYEAELREYLRDLEADQDKVGQYRNELFYTWRLDDERI